MKVVTEEKNVTNDGATAIHKLGFIGVIFSASVTETALLPRVPIECIF